MISVVSKITNLGISGGLAKVAGAAGLATVLYDSHHAGKISAAEFEKAEKADVLAEHFLSDMKADSPSVVKCAVKKQIFNMHLDENFTDFFANIKGYCGGFAKMLIGNTIPFALSAGALFTKGFLSKTFGLGLAAYGGVFILQHAFGIGKSE